MQYVISYDLGTGGLKAGLYSLKGLSVDFEFIPYRTYYPEPEWHEQRPADWWQAVCAATKSLIRKNQIDPSDICAVAASGHSLVAVPIDRQGEILLESVPIWSDRRAKSETREFFNQVDYEQWYLTTGNGDPPETYAVFKLMWLKKHYPKVLDQTRVILGSKDYINYRLTGRTATDFSYASGSGVFDLKHWRYADKYIQAAGLPASIFPVPIESHQLVGVVSDSAAESCGLCAGTKVLCGGVDNSCMALGTTGVGNGRVYTSLGSSSWIAITADQPILDSDKLPFVFAFIEKGYYTTGVSIFAAGSAYRWARETFCLDLTEEPYSQMDEIAATSPAGSNGILFNPSLAGGSSQEPDEALQGSFFGLTLSITRADLLRAILEGVALSLKCFCLPLIEPFCASNGSMIICGGGAKSDLWMQIFADVFDQPVVLANVDQDAASLGAAAIALRGAGIWKDYSPLDALFQVQKVFEPNTPNRDRYLGIAKKFSQWVNSLAKVHASMNEDQRSNPEWR